MGNAQIILNQLLKMVLYMAVGFGLCRGNVITVRSGNALSQLLLYVSLPSVIIRSYVGVQPERFPEILLSLLLGALVLLISIGIAQLLFRDHPMEVFSAAFSNAGFMGIPLISGVLGETSVCYIAGLVALLNVLQWSYGQRLLSGKTGTQSIRSLFANPLLLAFLAGLLICFLQIPVPAVLGDCLDAFAACNAPVAMVILGISIGNAKFYEIFSYPRAYLVSFVRLLLIPAITALVLRLLPGKYHDMKLALLIAACAPVGSNVVVYAQRNQLAVGDCTRSVCLSTLLSVLSMPCVIAAAEALWS